MREADAWIVRDKWGGFWLFGPDDKEGAERRQRKQSDEHGNVPELLALHTEAELARVRGETIEAAAKVCEAQDATMRVYNNPLNGMKHPVAEQSFRQCAAAIRGMG